ncbi:hypothetical protein D3C84_356390 [compost metagenome]
MHEHFQFHGRHLPADLGDLFQRQLPRQDDPAQALLLPELHARPVHCVGLHGQVDRHLGVVSAHQHDQPGVGHDQRIRGHGDDRFQVLEEGFQLGVVRGNVHHHVKTLALGLGLANAEGQVGVIELVVTHPQAVARLPGIDRVGAVGEGIAHVFQGAGRGEQFRGGEGHGGIDRKSSRG